MKHRYFQFASHVLAGILFMCAAQAAFAQGPELAPVNPEWLEFLEQAKLKKIQRMTDDGHALGCIPSPLDLSHLKGQRIPQTLRRVTYAASYDLRDHGKLTAVKNQNPYGTCWAFASYGSLESYLLTGETNDFSENNLVNLDGFDYGFDDGGNHLMSMAYLSRWAGPVNESDDPYYDIGGSPTNLTVQKHVQEALFIPARSSSTNNDLIKEAITNYGAVYTTIYYSDSYLNGNSYYYNGSASANHAVDIVGWNDDYSSTNFSETPSGDGAFIMRNSWGSGWGDGGYFYISYYDSKVGSVNCVFNNAESITNYLTVAQYDPLGWVGSWGDSATAAWGANVFPVSGPGTLSAVSFYTASVTSSYEIYIYTDVPANNPRGGTLETSQSGTLTYPGYHTITLNSPVSILSETNFSVVVKFTTPGYIYPIPIEYPLAGYSSAASASNGQSFASSDGVSWSDLAVLYDANVCIKAFYEFELLPPTGVSASDGTYKDKVAVNWNSAFGVSSYEVWRATYPAGDPSQAALLGETSSTNYNDTSVTAAVLYNYWLRSKTASETSSFSSVDSGWRSWLPGVPTGVSASDGTYSNKVRVTWSASANASSYVVYRNTSNDTSSASELGSTTGTTYNDTTAVASTTYYYWVKAVNDWGNISDFSSSDTGWRAAEPEPEPTPPQPSDDPAPDAPIWISATDGIYADKVRVTWSFSTYATTYEVWRSTTDNSSSATLLATATATGYDDTSAVMGTTYYYWVKAGNAQGKSGFSAGNSGYCAVIPPADLAVSDFQMLPDVMRVRASPDLVSVCVCNNGPNRMSDSNAWALLEVYLSDDETFGDADDISIGSVLSYMALSTGQTTDVQLTSSELAQLRIPSSVATGFYSVFLRVEHATFSDPDATNNVAQRVGPIEVTSPEGMVRNDFDGDRKTDLAVYHETSGYWYILLSGSGTLSYQKLGEPGYEPVPGDFDGDGKTDLVVYHEASGYWFIKFSSTRMLSYQKFGETGYSPVSGDFDGNWKTDMVVFHEVSGYWYILLSGIGTLSYQRLGDTGYEPVPGDFDGDGSTDVAVYHESSGYWFIKLSSSGALSSQKFGETGYSPVSGDFDGDGKTDLTVYHEASGYWFILLSSSETLTFQKLGEPGYAPVPGDFDGDGKTDVAVYHEASGYWFILFSSSGALSSQKFGESGYVPVW